MSKFIHVETQLKVGYESIWLWMSIEYETKKIIGIRITKGQMCLLHGIRPIIVE